jgi:hypothetical protein
MRLRWAIAVETNMLRTWARSVIGAALALMLMLALATQIVAAAFGQHPALGDGIMVVGGVKLYAPWNVLIWTGQWAARDLAVALVHAALIVVALLAAFAIAALVSALEPVSFVIRWRRSGFERWAKLNQRGLLRAEGLALGAVRRHSLARDDIVRCREGHALVLGASAYTDDALLAALSGWRGALVLVEARDLAAHLGRADVMRFAPGRSDSVAINPLLNVRGGAHAWSDAMALARAFMRTTDAMLVASFAALVLDTLAHGAPAARSFAGMRQALSDPQRRLAELCARWSDGASDLGPAAGELARIVRYWRRDGEAALRMLRDIDIALRLFADGDHALATEAHQLRLADLVSGDGPTALVIEMTAGKEREASAALVSALLAQLVAACASSPDLDQLGRLKRRDLLMVIEADALEALTAEASPMPAAAKKKLTPPILDQTLGSAHRRGVRLLVQARCVSDVAELVQSGDDDVGELMRVGFAAIAAIGAQTEASAAALAGLAGQRESWRRWSRQVGHAAMRWLLPYWECGDAWVVAPATLAAAEPSDGLLLFENLKPIRCRTLLRTGASSAFVTTAALPQAPHDWDAPPLPSAAQSKSAALVAPPPAQQDSVQAPTVPQAKLRRALARRSAPILPPTSDSRGDRLI